MLQMDRDTLLEQFVDESPATGAPNMTFIRALAGFGGALPNVVNPDDVDMGQWTD